MEPKKILIIEDDAFLREVYVDTLKSEGFTVGTAVDGEDAFAKIKQDTWDLILFDILLPKMNGFQVIEKLQKEPGFALQKNSIVFLTNLDKQDDIKKALSLGMGYLIKSQITPGDLVKEVKMYLEKGSVSTSAPPLPAA